MINKTLLLRNYISFLNKYSDIILLQIKIKVFTVIELYEFIKLYYQFIIFNITLGDEIKKIAV